MSPDQGKYINRRQFLKLGGTAVAATFLAACSKSQQPELTPTPVMPSETLKPEKTPAKENYNIFFHIFI